MRAQHHWFGQLPPIATPSRDHLLWALEKGEHRVECRMRTMSAGLELRILSDNAASWSWLTGDATLAEIQSEADGKRLEFTAEGWTAPGPRRVR